ncbi:ASCH domain-containing protein [Serinicoccus kebangsaanensis]|uniref:ASCH domain-containing protein n=1 Tax=Serinicoccus kebangsaanensis TaxID=2602069 RepID=UPI00124CFDC5|nr:ASCH domain-containing protein [Serinicoccus kebangsaanensis]
MSEQTPAGPERSPHDLAIAAFWEDARIRGKLNRIEVYAGAQVSDTLPPPAWSFGEDPATADRLLGLVLAGRKTATASALRDYEEDAQARHALEDEPRAEGDTLTRTGTDLDLALPEPGLLSILLDGTGRPRALIRITDVQVCRFGDVDDEHARLEGEGNRTLADWRAIHRDAFAATAPQAEPVDDDTLVVLERFEVLVPASARRAARALH